MWSLTESFSFISSAGPREFNDLGGTESGRAVVRPAWNHALHDVMIIPTVGQDFLEDDLWTWPN